MKNEKTKCTQSANVIVDLGGKLLRLCPVHANNIAILGNAIGAPVQARRISATENIECESNEPLTDQEVLLNKEFDKPK